MKKFVKLVLFIGAIAILAKVVAAKMADWDGLTESEIRAKLDSRLPKQVPDEKRATIADKVVSGMRERGALRDAEEQPDSDDAEVSEESSEVIASV